MLFGFMRIIGDYILYILWLLFSRKGLVKSAFAHTFKYNCIWAMISNFKPHQYWIFSIQNLNIEWWQKIRKLKTSTNRFNWMLCSIVSIHENELQIAFCIQILHINCGRVKSRFSLNLLSIKRVFVQVIMYYVHQIVYMRLISIHCCGYLQCNIYACVYDGGKSNRIQNE